MRRQLVISSLAFALAACASGESVSNSGSGGDGGGDGDGDAVDASLGAAPDAMTGTADAAPADAAPVEVDAAPATCPGDPCDLFEQCGCQGGEACDLAADPFAGNDCRTVATAGVEGDTCTGPDSCAAGYTCVADGSGAASCKAYCSDDSFCGQPRGQCLIQLASGGVDIPGAVVCTSSCDPTNIAAGGCPLGYGCFPFVIDNVPIVECAPSGAGTQNDACVDNADCAPDYLCTDTGTSTVCLRMCNNVGAACAAVNGTDCTGFVDPHVVGGTEYGVCF